VYKDCYDCEWKSISYNDTRVWKNILSRGSSGTEVTSLQKALKNEGVYSGDVTGYYGLLTEQAVQSFQEKHGIISYGSPRSTGYGNVGWGTLSKLNSLYDVEKTTEIPVYSAPSNYAASVVYSQPKINCPINSHVSTSDSSKCECDSGYDVNAAKNACVVSLSNANHQVCRASFGQGSLWDGTKDDVGQLLCGCAAGYNWNNARTACVLPEVKKPTPIEIVNPQQWCRVNNPSLTTEANIYSNGNFSCTCYTSSDPTRRAATGCTNQYVN